MLTKWKHVEFKIWIWPILIFSIWWSNFDPNCWNYFNGEKYWLNCLSDEKWQLNYRDEEKRWSNEGMSSAKSEFEPILIFYIWWSSFDTSRWNCFRNKSTELLKWQKISTKLTWWNKCWSNERNLNSKSKFEFILFFQSDSQVLIRTVKIELRT